MDYKLRWIEFNNPQLAPFKGRVPITAYTEQYMNGLCWSGHELSFKANSKSQVELFLYYCALILGYDLTTVDIEDLDGNLIYVEQDLKIGEYEKYIKENQGFNSNG